MEKPLSGRLIAQVAGGLERFAAKEITTLGGKNIEIVSSNLVNGIARVFAACVWHSLAVIRLIWFLPYYSPHNP